MLRQFWDTEVPCYLLAVCVWKDHMNVLMPHSFLGDSVLTVAAGICQGLWISSSWYLCLFPSALLCCPCVTCRSCKNSSVAQPHCRVCPLCAGAWADHPQTHSPALLACPLPSARCGSRKHCYICSLFWKRVYCLTRCLGCCSNSAMLGFPLAIAARLPVCCVAFSGCWCMLISKMFVANQSIANCNQTLFSKLAKLFSHTEFIIAIKRVMTFLTLTLKYLKSLPVICCYDKLWSEYWESSVQADTLAHVHLNYSSRLIYKKWGLGVSLEYTICLNLSGRWLTLLFAPDKSVWVVCKNEISLLKTII